MIILKQRATYVLIFLFSIGAAQTDSLKSRVSERQYFCYTYSNDFFEETDRYFTQEIHPELVLKFLRKLPLMKAILQLRHSTIQYGLNGTQDCFTPASIRRDSILRGDRPYSGTITLGHFKISNDSANQQRLTSQLDLGMIGSCAWCAEEQKGIHKLFNNIQPLGWENQIANDVYVNYKVRYDKSIFALKWIDLVALAEVNAGTVYDNASLGANLRVGRIQGYFDNRRSRKLQFYATGQGWIKAVGYNATLQGGFFSHSVNTLRYDQVAPFVLKGVFATGISYRWLSIEHGYVFITREIKQWWDHGWGYISICGWF